MNELSIIELAVACSAVTVGYTVFGMTGFGANMVALPVLAHVMSLRTAVPTLLILDLLSAALLSSRNRESVEVAELKHLAFPMLAGMALGFPLLALAPESGLLALLGAFVGAVSLWNLVGRAGGRTAAAYWVWPAGLVGGAFSTVFGTGGPVYTLFLASRIADTTRLRATVAAVILVSALVRLLLFTGSGFLYESALPALAAALLPCALAGYLMGSRLHLRMPQAQVRRVIWMVLVAAAVSLLARGTMGLI